MTNHETYMRRALHLAGLGGRAVQPNPMVGAVVAGPDGQIISEGWHRYFGGHHGEVDAIFAAPEGVDWSQVTLYVTLEPCNHFGKTPPCTNLIIEKGIKSVVVGCQDPNPQVSGKGIARLREAGVEVICPVLEQECEMLNKRFFTLHLLKRPYIIVKWAQTPTGAMGYISGNRLHITGDEANQLVHQWRTEETAILVGARTAINDNPALTARLYPGRSPIRVILDNRVGLPKDLTVFDGGAETIVLSQEEREYPNARTIVSDCTPADIGAILAKEGIASVLVEGGATTLHNFMTAQIFDEMRVFVGDAAVTEPWVQAPSVNLLGAAVSQVGKDRLYQVIRPQFIDRLQELRVQKNAESGLA